MKSNMKSNNIKSRKIFLSALILGLTSTAIIPTASAEGFNIGFDYGRTEAKKYCKNITNCSDSDRGPKFDVGYEFNQNFSAELGYTSFGTIFDATDNIFTASQDSHAATLTGLGILPINEMFSIYGRLGYARYKTNSSGMVQGVKVRDKDGNTPVWGIGAKYDVNDKLGVRIEFQDYSDISRVDGSKDDVQGLYLGVVYRL